jgi:uncharacterized protein (DUF2062 family)
LVFKRRDKRAWWKVIAESLYPKGGWARAFHYIRHRLHRLPDPPHKIARGVWAGVFTTFTPFYGMHFIVAALVSRVMQGNLIAALLATFFGNPLTYIPIGVASLKTGHWLLGTEFEVAEQKLGGKFAEAGGDLWHNFMSMFTEETADWHGLSVFYDEVFFPLPYRRDHSRHNHRVDLLLHRSATDPSLSKPPQRADQGKARCPAQKEARKAKRQSTRIKLLGFLREFDQI